MNLHQYVYVIILVGRWTNTDIPTYNFTNAPIENSIIIVSQIKITLNYIASMIPDVNNCLPDVPISFLFRLRVTISGHGNKMAIEDRRNSGEIINRGLLDVTILNLSDSPVDRIALVRIIIKLCCSHQFYDLKKLTLK